MGRRSDENNNGWHGNKDKTKRMSRIEEYDLNCDTKSWRGEGRPPGVQPQAGGKDGVPALLERLHKDLEDLRKVLDSLPPQSPPVPVVGSLLRAPGRLGYDQLRLLVEHVPGTVWTMDQAGNLVFISRGVETICGYASEEMLALGNCMRAGLIHPDDIPLVRAACQALFRDDTLFELEYRIIRKAGDYVWVNDRALVTFSEGGVKFAHGIMTDITERKRAEEQACRRQAELAHVARLNTMGEMASMLAHELNQPLAAIINYTQGCVRRLRSSRGGVDELCAVMEEVRGQAERAGEIIRRLRRFVTKGEPRTAEADINALVHEVAGLAEPEARQNGVEVRLELAQDLALVQVDAIQIQQVILNLVRNAIDAMSGAGLERRILRIRTSMADSGDEVEVAVSDTGFGVPPDIVEEIFSPFFTTKTKGMGVGLSFSRSLIEAHGGRLGMRPNPDGGATFLFTLPVNTRCEPGAAALGEGDC